MSRFFLSERLVHGYGYVGKSRDTKKRASLERVEQEVSIVNSS